MVQEEPFKSKVEFSQVWVGSPAIALSGTNLPGKREMVFTNNAGTTAYLINASGIMASGTGVP